MKEIKTITIKCETQDALELAELTEFQGGLKERTDVDFDRIKLSIVKFGFSFPFYVWKDKNKNWILDGHGRFSTLCKMQKDGYIIPPLPVVYIECKNRKEAKEKLLRLNSTYGKMTKESVLEFADGLDLEKIKDEIALPDTLIDFSDLGIQDEEEDETDETTPDVEEKAVSKVGELYQLGNSFLLCGDSTKREDLERLLNGVNVDLVFTDPPYGISVVQNDTVGGEKVAKVHTYKKIIGDETTDTARLNYELIKEVSANQIIFGGNYFTDFLYPSKCWVVWDKENTGNFADCELAWTSFDKPAKLYKWLWNGMSRQGNRTDEGKTRVHPTQKPAGLISEILEDFTEEGNSVLDCFGGSGSTLIACEKTNRKAFLMELDPHYCDVIRRRYTLWAKENKRELTSGCLE